MDEFSFSKIVMNFRNSPFKLNYIFEQNSKDISSSNEAVRKAFMCVNGLMNARRKA